MIYLNELKEYIESKIKNVNSFSIGKSLSIKMLSEDNKIQVIKISNPFIDYRDCPNLDWVKSKIDGSLKFIDNKNNIRRANR